MKNLDGEIRPHFIDFPAGRTRHLLILDAWGDGYVFQASILREGDCMTYPRKERREFTDRPKATFKRWRQDVRCARLGVKD